MDQELLNLVRAVASLTTQVQSMGEDIKEHKKTIDDLVALANQGKGSIWLMMSAAGILGFFASHAKTFFTAITR